MVTPISTIVGQPLLIVGSVSTKYVDVITFSYMFSDVLKCYLNARK